MMHIIRQETSVSFETAKYFWKAVKIFDNVVMKN